MFNDYFFFYKDTMNKWSVAKNPVFIASHTKCRAIKKSEVLEKFNNELQLMNKLNDYFSDEKAENFVRDTILNEIL